MTRLELAAQQVDCSRYEVLGDGKASVAIFRPRFGNDQLSHLCRTQVTTASARWRRLTVRHTII